MSISSLGIALKVPSLAANSLDAATAAYAANIDTAGGSISAASLTANDQLVKGLKADGLWNLLHEIYTFSGDFTAALVKLKTVTAQSTLTNHNFVSGDFSKSSGLKGNGTSKYLRSGYIPNTHGTLNSASLGVWNASTGAGGGGTMGVVTGSNSVRQALLAPFSDGTLYSDCYDVTSGRLSAAVSSPYQLLSSSRTSSTSHKIYQNGNSLATNSTNGGSQPLHELYLFTLNVTGSPSSAYTSHRLSFGFIGLGLTDVEMQSLYDRVLGFQQAMGRVV
jgi:hypothetical protein